MDVKYLRHFLAVAEELHFGRAAHRLNMEQAPLSQSIRRFEGRLGVELFVRSRRGGTRLSAAGTRMLDEARKAVDQYDRAVAAAQQTVEEVRDPVSVGFVTAGLLRLLPGAIREFATRFADADIRLQEGSTAELIDGVVSRQLDLALMNEPAKRPSDITFELLRRDKTLAALPKSHPLATASPLTLSALAPEPLIFFPRDAAPGLHDGILAAFAAAGGKPRIDQQARSTPTILSLVGAGLGYALVQESAQELPFADVVYQPVSDLPDDVSWNLQLVWNPPTATPSTRMFARQLRDTAAEQLRVARV